MNGTISSGNVTVESCLMQTGATVTITSGGNITGELVDTNSTAINGGDDIKHIVPASTAGQSQLADEVDSNAFSTQSDSITAVVDINNDTLNIQLGNYSIDTLSVSAAAGVDIGTATTDIVIGSGNTASTLAGGTQEQSQYSWMGSDGQTSYVFTPFLAGTQTIGTLEVSGGVMGASELFINDFNLVDAEQNPTGYLGIKLGSSLQIDQGIGAAPSSDSSSAQRDAVESGEAPSSQSGNPVYSFDGGGAQTYTIYVDAGSTANREVDLKLTGASFNDFLIDANNSEFGLASDGSFSISLAAGLTQVSFALVDVSNQDGTSDLAAGGTLVLTASMSSGSQAETLLGSANIDYVPDTFDVAKPASIYSAVNGVLANGVTTFSGDGLDDIAIGSGNSDLFNLRNSGNDSVVGGSGANTITGGMGNEYLFRGYANALGGPHRACRPSHRPMPAARRL